MGRLFDLIEDYRSRYAPHEPNYSRVAEQVGVSRQTLLNWRTPTKLIDKTHLTAVAEVTGVPYLRVLDALLEDIGYLQPASPEELSPPTPMVAGDELRGLPNVAHKRSRKAKGRDGE